MKVLMFGWEFPPHITGGLGTACYGLTKGLLNNNVEVIFVVPKAYGDEDTSQIRLVNASDIKLQATYTDIEDFWKKITYLEINSLILPYIDPLQYERSRDEEIHYKKEGGQSVLSYKYNFSGKYTGNLLEEVSRYALITRELVEKYDFDIIHAHDWLTYPAGIAAKFLSGKPLVVHMHATEFDRSGENVNQNVYDIERRGMEVADKVITVSNYTRSLVIDRYSINPDKVITVHNAVEPPKDSLVCKINKGVKEKIVTFLGRVTFQKGPDYFVEAAYKVLQKTENVRFVMAGSGDMLERMIKRVAQLGISRKFHFTGFLNPQEVRQMFSITDVYVMPSVSEPFGISPLEAMQFNVPVIISKQSGVSEILNYAIKVDFWDIDALAGAIYSLLNYRSLADTFREKGKEEVINMRWENSAMLVKQVYESLIKH